MNTETDTQEFTASATYCPEDNKLRLYIGRVPREEYLALREEGWVALHKQREAGKGDFAATWTPERRDTALRYAGMIEDEDAGPEERAADRAERFGGYLEKRLDEAGGYADRYEAGPSVHGFQSYAKAVRAADRHDRIGTKAVDAWEKAEYWQRRTAGVIQHALYRSSPGVRMGRIKELEASIRKAEKSRDEYEATRNLWLHCSQMQDVEAQNERAKKLAYVEHGNYTHPRTGKVSYLYDHCDTEDGRNADPLSGAELCALYLAKHGPLSPEGPWLTHYRLRLAYENQMLEAQGGRAAFVEMEVGGWIGKHQIRKVNKSNATGRVVSVTLRMQGNRWGNEPKPGEYYEKPFNIERLPQDAYRAPTEEEKAEFVQKKKAEKAAAPKADPCPLINPTDEDAERLQAAINERHSDKWKRHHGEPTEHYKPKSGSVQRITQAVYSANSKGSYARAETRALHRNMELADRVTNMYSSHGEERRRRIGKPVCQIRITGYDPVSVIVLTDKPQKPIPVAVWEKLAIAETVNA